MSIDTIEAICVMCILFSPVLLVMAWAGYNAIDLLPTSRNVTYTSVRWTLALVGSLIPWASFTFAIVGAVQQGSSHLGWKWVVYIVAGTALLIWSLSLDLTLILHAAHQHYAFKFRASQSEGVRAQA